MTVRHALLVPLLVCCLAAAVAPSRAQETSTPLLQTWVGDFGGMVKRGRVRALVTYDKMLYFLDQGTQRGGTYELLKQFEDFVNRKLQSDAVDVVFVPVPRDQLIPALLDGRGDIAAADLTVTPQRATRVAFSDPLLTGVEQLLVTGPTAPAVTNLADLSGKEIHVRGSSSYYHSLHRLNELYRAQGMDEIRIVLTDEYFEDSDLLELVSAGLIPMVIVDSHKARFWGEIFRHIEVREDIVLNAGGQIAWAFRPDSPQLANVINQFLKSREEGILVRDPFYKTYLRENKWARNVLSRSEMRKLKGVVGLFQKYADRYEFDWLIVAAQAYQESGLDQSRRSHKGAVGVMQVLPETAAGPNVGIPDIEQLEPNIHAGVKYLRFVQDRYFSSEKLDVMDSYLFTLAAYNAGPARVQQLRKEAARMGLSPDRWFGHVEVVAAKRIGRETVQYVSNIYKYYVAYSHAAQELELQSRAGGWVRRREG